jgi:hypothetical protein
MVRHGALAVLHPGSGYDSGAGQVGPWLGRTLTLANRAKRKGSWAVTERKNKDGRWAVADSA